MVGRGYIPWAEYTVSFGPGGAETNQALLVMPTAHIIANAEGEIHDDDIYIDSWGAWLTDDPTATITAPDGPPQPQSQPAGRSSSRASLALARP